jgi:hypothetical protein
MTDEDEDDRCKDAVVRNWVTRRRGETACVHLARSTAMIELSRAGDRLKTATRLSSSCCPRLLAKPVIDHAVVNRSRATACSRRMAPCLAITTARRRRRAAATTTPTVCIAPTLESDANKPLAKRKRWSFFSMRRRPCHRRYNRIRRNYPPPEERASMLELARRTTRAGRRCD